MLKVNQTLNKVRDRLFENIHRQNLIYNTCWEDPNCDREMMEIDEQSEIVMITSAGCNALDYLLDNPKQVNTIDVNPRQNALLQLKRSVLEKTDFEQLWKFFGEGYNEEALEVYEQALKPDMPTYAQEVWDKKLLSYFVGKGLKKSFYYHGTSGSFAWLFQKYLQSRPKINKKIMQLLEADTLEEQKELYEQIEPKMVNLLIRWLMNRHLTLSMLGVPRAQRQLILDDYKGGVGGFVIDCLRQVFMELPTKDNYFWRLYITGKYAKGCEPNYLKEEYFETLKERSKNISTHTTTISDFLKKNTKPYSHYVLLDHQDWLAAHNVPALNEEWELILKNSKKGTKILLRSAALRIDFFPDFVKEAVEFQTEQTDYWHKKDRVGTYGSAYMAVVK